MLWTSYITTLYGDALAACIICSLHLWYQQWSVTGHRPLWELFQLHVACTISLWMNNIKCNYICTYHAKRSGIYRVKCCTSLWLFRQYMAFCRSMNPWHVTVYIMCLLGHKVSRSIVAIWPMHCKWVYVSDMGIQWGLQLCKQSKRFNKQLLACYNT